MDKTIKQDDNILTISILLIAMCLYLFGVYLHWKIIKVSIKDKEMTWKIDITNSCLVIAHGLHNVVMHSITYVVADLYTYTGKWFCYTSKVLFNYGYMYMFGHSLVISIMKYIIIVKWEKTRDFGKEKLIEIFFWINFLQPVVRILFQLIITPNFYWDYDGFIQIERCLGDPKGILVPGSNRSMTKYHDLCFKIAEPSEQDYFTYMVYIGRSSLCWINLAIIYLVVWNFIEMLIYCQTFGYMRR